MRNWGAASFLRDSKGASAVEFALLILPFLLLLFGTIEFGRAFWAREALQSVAASTARCMGVLSSACAPSGTYDAGQARTYLKAQARALGLSLSDGDITLEPLATCSGVPGFSRVTISYVFETAVPFLLDPLSPAVPLEAEACFPNQSD